ncbi:formate dehydrogenase subunit gamma [Variovorax boronicumulans]|uniref:Formate dehydrogenase subunit gamma n=1 Tax=Variovorax boronicumulans TaxID=436515 RepID=A0AAW8DVG7_9BURK|nr:formate dehydrogenase subunit gamma [Variovorax boronicumulans]MDP9878039.1 formate dehydrogenase subunit gamma [Variovorax boronicumulans]MDP9923322.1 formate dehydrogenase subunit gamma [Variovorax boronicumulans]
MIAVASLSPADALATVLTVLERWADEPGPLLPILHDVQEAVGYIPAHVVPNIADALNLSRAEVHGVISYYHHFRTEPAARVIQICRAESCQAMGSEALLAHARQHLGCALHGTSKDGAFTLEPIYCLGLCASSPALMLDDEPHARMTPERFDALVAQTRRVT